jgi:hypothetical protein
MSQQVVLCEGYDDRAFWKGCLLRLGCRSAESDAERQDEWGRPVAKGRYLYFTPEGHRLLVEPCRSREHVPRAAQRYFNEQTTHPIQHLVLNIDSDLMAGDAAEAIGRTPEVIGQLILREQSEEERGTNRVRGIEVSSVIWECADPPAAGIPEKQTLERLVSAAIREAHSGRGESVARWLNDPPVGDPGDPKAHGLSYLAKWYATHGVDDFYAHVWRDNRVAAALEGRLRTTGAWAKIERVIAA